MSGGGVIGRDAECAADDSPPEAATVAAALLTVLRALAAEPLLVAIDDVQWLDRASGRALTFALRRLGVEPVALLCTRRSRVAGRSSVTVDQALGPARTRSLTVGPLTIGAVHALLLARLGVAFHARHCAVSMRRRVATPSSPSSSGAARGGGRRARSACRLRYRRRSAAPSKCGWPGCPFPRGGCFPPSRPCPPRRLRQVGDLGVRKRHARSSAAPIPTTFESAPDRADQRNLDHRWPLGPVNQ